MLDPKVLHSVMNQSANLGNNAQTELQKPFIQGMQTMEMSGSDAARSIMDTVNQSCMKMIEDMNNVFSGLQDNVDAHQKMQQAEKPKDFDTAMNDLREKLSTGFPQEMKNLFDKMPKL